MEAAVAADEGDGSAEEKAFEDAAKEVEFADILGGVVNVVVTIDSEDYNAVKVTTDDAHVVGHDRKGGDEEEAGKEPGNYKVVIGACAHRGEGVDLFGDSHRAEFSGHGAADAAREHRASEDRAEFADEGHVDYGAETGFDAELAELEIALHGEDHADERSRERDDRQAKHADLVEVRKERFSLRAMEQHPVKGVKDEEREITGCVDGINHDATPGSNPISEGHECAAGGGGITISVGREGAGHAMTSLQAKPRPAPRRTSRPWVSTEKVGDLSRKCGAAC